MTKRYIPLALHMVQASAYAVRDGGDGIGAALQALRVNPCVGDLARRNRSMRGSKALHDEALKASLFRAVLGLGLMDRLRNGLRVEHAYCSVYMRYRGHCFRDLDL